MSGKFITIEGTDGAGKSTQIQLLVKHLEGQGFKVLVTREPGGTPISEKIRKIILDVENGEMDYTAEMLLYAASRAQHINEKIIPAIKEGKIVICDRFVDSSYVYQGYARGIPLKLIEEINDIAVKNLMPHLTLFFDIPPAIGISRKKGMKQLDRIEKEDIDFHEKVYQGYKTLLARFPERIKRVDATLAVEQVHSQVLNIVKHIV